jgi:hypothetical protein
MNVQSTHRSVKSVEIALEHFLGASLEELASKHNVTAATAEAAIRLAQSHRQQMLKIYFASNEDRKAVFAQFASTEKVEPDTGLSQRVAVLEKAIGNLSTRMDDLEADLFEPLDESEATTAPTLLPPLTLGSKPQPVPQVQQQQADTQYSSTDPRRTASDEGYRVKIVPSAVQKWHTAFCDTAVDTPSVIRRIFAIYHRGKANGVGQAFVVESVNRGTFEGVRLHCKSHDHSRTVFVVDVDRVNLTELT